MEDNDSEQALDVIANPVSTTSKFETQLSVDFSDSSYSSCETDEGLYSSCFQDARMIEILESSSSNLTSFTQNGGTNTDEAASANFKPVANSFSRHTRKDSVDDDLVPSARVDLGGDTSSDLERHDGRKPVESATSQNQESTDISSASDFLPAHDGTEEMVSVQEVSNVQADGPGVAGMDLDTCDPRIPFEERLGEERGDCEEPPLPSKLCRSEQFEDKLSLEEMFDVQAKGSFDVKEDFYSMKNGTQAKDERSKEQSSGELPSPFDILHPSEVFNRDSPVQTEDDSPAEGLIFSSGHEPLDKNDYGNDTSQDDGSGHAERENKRTLSETRDCEVVDPLKEEQEDSKYATFHSLSAEQLDDKVQFCIMGRSNSAGKEPKGQGVKGGLLIAMNRLSSTFDEYDIIDSKEVKEAETEPGRRGSSSEEKVASSPKKEKGSFKFSKKLHRSKEDKKEVAGGTADSEKAPCLTGFKNGIDLHYSVKRSSRGEVVEEICMTSSTSESGKYREKPSFDLPLIKGETSGKRTNSPIFYDVLGTPELENLGIAVGTSPKNIKRSKTPRSLKMAIAGGSLRGAKRFGSTGSINADPTKKATSKHGIVMTAFVKTPDYPKQPISLDGASGHDSADSDFDHVDLADAGENTENVAANSPTEHRASSVKVKVRPPIPLKKPVPPPRHRKVRSFYSLSSTQDNAKVEETRRSSLRSSSLPSEQTTESKSEDSIFKGLIPFFEGDPKRRGSLVPFEKGLSLPRSNSDRLILMTDSFPTTVNDFPEDRRSLVALEMYTTERSFVRGLETIVQLFKRKLQLAGHLDAKECEIVFSNIEELFGFSKNILISLWKRISTWSDDQMISDIFLENVDGFKKFSIYCQNYDTAEAYIKQKLKKKKDMESFLNTCYSNPVCQAGLTLPSYLITVVQRIPRYILLLKDLSKRTKENHPDYPGLKAAVAAMEKVATFINEQLKQSQSQRALEALQTQIIGLKDYYISGRNLVYENTVCLMTIKRTYQCVLFNDLLVFAIKSGGRQSEVELVLDLSIVWLEDLHDWDPQTTKKDAIALYTPDRPYTMYVGTRGEKKLWLQHLEKAIRRHTLSKDAREGQNLERRHTSYTYKNGAVYSGEYLNAKRHGEGIMMWPNQMTYRGQWRDDERNGMGILEYGSGEVYEGHWADDNQSGQGKLVYSSLDVFVGEWSRGIRHGKGRIQFQNGDLFDGTFANDRIEGEGRLVCKNGLFYEGTWRRNMKHGKGFLRDIEGNEYNGEFKEDKFHGSGEMTYNCGAVYNGSWEMGKRQGPGTYHVMGGIVYEGQWMDDMMEGHGMITYPNGDVYEGTWIQGRRFGKGTLRYNDGSFYNGQWEDDGMSGEGTMDYHDGAKYEGHWKSGRRYGHGRMKHKSGCVYEGDWRDDLYNGKGMLEKPSGWKFEGYWLDGKRSGYGVLYDPLNNYKYEGQWTNDFKEGKGTEMMFGYVYEGEFKEDKRDGHGSQSSPDSSIYEGSWKKGQKHGKGVKRLPNGMRQNQIWQMGCLMETPAMVSRGLPQLERF